jgi:hypothetical protein
VRDLLVELARNFRSKTSQVDFDVQRYRQASERGSFLKRIFEKSSRLQKNSRLADGGAQLSWHLGAKFAPTLSFKNFLCPAAFF